jgi:Lar family restriction alleviation protein
MTMAEKKLKRCPFCGAPADISRVYDENGKYKGFYTVFCTNVLGCGAGVDSGDEYLYLDEDEARWSAIERWNRRA